MFLAQMRDVIAIVRTPIAEFTFSHLVEVAEWTSVGEEQTVGDATGVSREDDDVEVNHTCLFV